MRYSLTVLAFLVLPACASSGSDPLPAPRQAEVRIEDQRIGSVITLYNESSVTVFLVPHPVEEVWQALQGVWPALELPVSEFDQQRRLIRNAGFRTARIDGKRMSHFVDCGQGMTGPNADRFHVHVTLSTTLVPRENGTELVVDMDGQGKPREHSGNWMHCPSRGNLETLIAERLQARLEGTGD